MGFVTFSRKDALIAASILIGVTAAISIALYVVAFQ